MNARQIEKYARLDWIDRHSNVEIEAVIAWLIDQLDEAREAQP